MRKRRYSMVRLNYSYGMLSMKKLLFLSAAVLLSACNGPIFGDAAPKFMIETPYGDNEKFDEMPTPDVYALAATRATNRMLDRSAEIYEKNPAPKLYISKIQKMSPNLPDGLYYAKDATRGIIEGSRSFIPVNNLNDADYYLETKITEIPAVGRETPIIEYKLILNTSDNKPVGEWSETIRQLQNDDKSWW